MDYYNIEVGKQFPINIKGGEGVFLEVEASGYLLLYKFNDPT